MNALNQDTLPRDVVYSTPDETATNRVGLFRYWSAAILLLLTFAFCVPTVPSADMWWHLSTGRYVVQNHSVPHTDPFSATITGRPWTAHEWLSGVIFYLAYSQLGPQDPCC